MANEGAVLLFGGNAIKGTTVPNYYGLYEPTTTAIFIPLNKIVKHLELVTKEVFGPFQIITEYETEEDLVTVLEILEKWKIT